MKTLKLGDKVKYKGIEGIIILNPKYQRKIQVAFSKSGVLIVKRGDLE